MIHCPYCKEELNDRELVNAVYLYHQDNWFAAKHADCYPIFFHRTNGRVQLCIAKLDQTNLYLIPGDGENIDSDYEICTLPNKEAQISYKDTVKRLGIATEKEMSRLYIGR